MISLSSRPSRRGSCGFTLVEMLVSVVILILLVGMLLQISSSMGRTWKYANLKIEEFKQARQGFATMTQRLSEATLNTYWGYDNPSAPKKYIRLSELRFVSGPGLLSSSSIYPTHAVFFQAPLGYSTNYEDLTHLLNTWGYYIKFGSDQGFTPSFLTTNKYRYRLMEMTQPSESMSIYKYTSGPATGTPLNCENYTGLDWVPPAPSPEHILADNVIALILSPQISPSDASKSGQQVTTIAPDYTYNSHKSTTSTSTASTQSTTQNDLPPVMVVTMVAIDEASAQRLEAKNSNGQPPEITNALSKLTSVASNYANDLSQLETALGDAKINYRVFTLNVKLPNSTFNGLLTYSGN